MKLRNKKTGKLININLNVNMVDEDYICVYGSLEEFNEDWEDYEEPKEPYHINSMGEVGIFSIDDRFTDAEKCFISDSHLEIGNYFETKEEAEKAVEKLKAWKRLKDNGFKFEGVEKRGRHINFYQGRSYETDEQCQQAMKDLDLLFGGEE